MATTLFPARLLNAGSIGVVSTTTGIDGTAIATTPIYTVPAGKSFVFVGAVVRMTAVSGFVTTGTAGVGVTGNDIVPLEALTGLNTTTEAYSMTDPNTAFRVGAAADVVNFNISVGYVAGSATLSVDLIGYLL